MRLPRYLYSLSPVGETLTAIETAQARLESEVASRNAQLCVSTAGEEGLSLWERDCSLPDGTGLSPEERRVRIRTALLGGSLLTRSYLRTLARQLGGADWGEVREDFASGRVTLTAYYEGRAPEGVTALRQAVERLRPSHLQVDIVPVMALRGTLRRYHTLTGKVMLTLPGRLEP